MMKEAELCCGTTADKAKVRAHIHKLETKNKALRSENAELRKLVSELTTACESVGMTRRFDS